MDRFRECEAGASQALPSAGSTFTPRTSSSRRTATCSACTWVTDASLGCRNIAVERKGNWVRRAARDSFKNRSEDILGIFAAACDLVGVYHTRSSVTTISIYRKDAVARLDSFIGPKQ